MLQAFGAEYNSDVITQNFAFRKNYRGGENTVKVVIKMRSICDAY